MKSVTIHVPATTANLGPGFDTLGLALDLWNETEFSETGDGPLTLTVVGEGEVDWPTMFRICEGAGGTEWYIIEDEATVGPMERIKTDIQNLRKLLAKFHA